MMDRGRQMPGQAPQGAGGGGTTFGVGHNPLPSGTGGGTVYGQAPAGAASYGREPGPWAMGGGAQQSQAGQQVPMGQAAFNRPSFPGQGSPMGGPFGGGMPSQAMGGGLHPQYQPQGGAMPWAGSFPGQGGPWGGGSFPGSPQMPPSLETLFGGNPPDPFGGGFNPWGRRFG